MLSTTSAGGERASVERSQHCGCNSPRFWPGILKCTLIKRFERNRTYTCMYTVITVWNRDKQRVTTNVYLRNQALRLPFHTQTVKSKHANTKNI